MAARVRTRITGGARKYLFGNLTAKLMALAMALALWLYADHFSRAKTTFSRVSLEVVTSEGWTVAEPRAGSTWIRATLSYPRRSEKQVQQAVASRDVRVVCTVKPASPGSDDQSFSVPLSEGDLVRPGAWPLNVMDFHPERLTVRLVREEVRSLEVVPRISAPPRGYEVAFSRPTPTRVLVRGRKDILARATKIGTEPEIDITMAPPLNEVEWDVSPTVRVADHVEVDGVKYPVACNAQVQCRVRIVRAATERKFAKVPINLLIPNDYPHAATLSGARVADVHVTGPAHVVDALVKENIHLYVGVGNLKPQDLPQPQKIRDRIVNTMNANQLIVRIVPFTAPVMIENRPGS